MKKTQIKDILAKNGITVESVFVPFSKSRNATEKNPSLNWQVTVKQNGRKIVTTDYMAGCAHAPFYKKIKNPMRPLAWEHAEIVRECETGFPVTRAKADSANGIVYQDKNSPILPDAEDVIYSLLMDMGAIDYADFEDWASEFGYETDSRAAEKTYNACLKIGLQMRQMGESVLAELKEAFQDY